MINSLPRPRDTSFETRKRNALPEGWTPFFDRVVPDLVKQKYLPERLRKSTSPFNDKDAWFFYPGIQELSDFLQADSTEKRGAKYRNYMSVAKFQSSYLLFFFPFQAHKFFTLFNRYESFLLERIPELIKNNEPLRVLDFGSGPGTASIAFWFWLKKHATQLGSPSLEFIWADRSHRSFEEIEKELLKRDTTLKIRRLAVDDRNPLEDALDRAGPIDLILMGHVLNENKDLNKRWGQSLGKLHPSRPFPRLGVLSVEPADRESAQELSQLRDHLFESGNAELEVLGPCLHKQSCPLKTGKDWCHFSFREETAGKWFNHFCKKMSTVREWLKLSYLWVVPGPLPAPLLKSREGQVRVVSDPLPDKKGEFDILLCAPQKPERKHFARWPTLGRGDLIKK